MFLFSREFIENLDRRFGHVLSLEGREFVIQARTLFSWLACEPRTLNVLNSLIAELEVRAKALRDLARGTASKLAALRRDLEEKCPDTRDAGVPEENNIEGHQTEHLTFRAFDMKHGVLIADAPVPLSLSRLSNDLVAPLVEVLASKRSAVRRFTIVNGESIERTPGQKKEIATLLAAWDGLFGRLRSSHGAAFREATLSFSASGGRVVFLLTRYLEQHLFGIGFPAARAEIELVGEREGTGATYMAFRDAVFDTDNAQADEIKKNEETINGWVEVLKAYLRSLHVALRIGLDERGSMIAAIQRYRLRSELHDVSRLRELAELVDEGKVNRKAELRLTADLAKYLFDAGFDTFSEVTRGEGRADLVHFGGSYVEAKQGDGKKDLAELTIDAYWQAQDGIRQFLTPDQLGGVKAMILAIFVRGGRRLELPPSIPARDDAVETFPVVIDLREAGERGSKDPKQPLQCVLADFQARPISRVTAKTGPSTLSRAGETSSEGDTK